MSSAARPPFHLALAVHELAATRRFYVQMLGCTEGRSAPRWVDVDFFGHQLSFHLVDGVQAVDRGANPVDGDSVPIPHFGAILLWDAWHETAERLQAAGVAFDIAPRVRFAGQPGEQATMFFRDPSGNAIELKSFQDPARIFATE